MADADESVKEQYLGSVDALKYQKQNVGNSEEILSFKLPVHKIKPGNSDSTPSPGYCFYLII